MLQEQWKSKAKEYLALKNNPMANQYYVNKLKEDLMWVNLNQSLEEDRELIDKVFQN